MIRKEDVYRIGKIGKPHGVKGELSFYFEDDIFDRTDADYLILEVDGILVPFFFEEYRFRSDETALVTFSNICTQQQARELTGCEVFFPRVLDDTTNQISSWAQIIGFRLIDVQTNQEIGKIVGIDNSTINILFELDNGRLLPAHDDFIKDIDTKQQIIKIDLPDGLLGL